MSCGSTHEEKSDFNPSLMLNSARSALRGIMKLFLDAKCVEELGERDAVCFGCLPDGLAAGDGAPDTAHAELEEGLGCLGLCLEELIDRAVSGYLRHSIS